MSADPTPAAAPQEQAAGVTPEELAKLWEDYQVEMKTLDGYVIQQMQRVNTVKALNYLQDAKANLYPIIKMLANLLGRQHAVMQQLIIPATIRAMIEAENGLLEELIIPACLEAFEDVADQVGLPEGGDVVVRDVVEELLSLVPPEKVTDEMRVRVNEALALLNADDEEDETEEAGGEPPAEESPDVGDPGDPGEPAVSV